MIEIPVNSPPFWAARKWGGLGLAEGFKPLKQPWDKLRLTSHLPLIGIISKRWRRIRWRTKKSSLVLSKLIYEKFHRKKIRVTLPRDHYGAMTVFGKETRPVWGRGSLGTLWKAVILVYGVKLETRLKAFKAAFRGVETCLWKDECDLGTSECFHLWFYFYF